MHVVVVGGGFGGVKTALELSKRQIGKITLISDESYFLHHATLYATATGRNIAESVIPLKTIFAEHPNVEVVEDRITSFDPKRHLIKGKKDYHYDSLVLALGSVTTFFGVKGAADHAYGIQSLNQIHHLQQHLHDEIVNKKLDKDFYIVGAGSTGIELAGALNEYLKTIKTLYRLKNTRSTVTLIEAASRIAPHMSETATAKIKARLKREGIKILDNHKVDGLDSDSIAVNGKEYPTQTAIWTSGSVNNPFFKENAEHFQLAPNGRVLVNSYLEALDDVFVIGDNNTVKYSGMAWPALKQATHVAINLARKATHRPLKEFIPRSVPVGVPIGDSWGYVEWFGIYAAGRTGAFIRRQMELYGYCQIVPYKVALQVWRAHDIPAIEA
ncbi:MAG: FAD-dependent oxidoreductase [Patescibacteria group bacterium]